MESLARRSFLALTAAVVIGARTGAAQSPPPLRLSFAEAVRRASGEAPAVALATLRTDEAAARVRQARGGLLPSFAVSAGWFNRTFNSKSLGITFPTVPGQPPTPDLVGPFSNYDARFTATQTLFDWSARARVRAAQSLAMGAGAERSAVGESAAQTAALAYLRGARAAQAVGARRADSGLAAELVRLAAAQKAAGVSAAIDVTRARTQLAVAEGLLIVAENASDRARIDLARALGLDPATALELSDALASSLATADVPVDRDSGIAQAVGTRPDLGAEVARGVSARRTSSAIAAERLPRLSLEADYGVNGLTVPGAISTRQLAVAVSIPILDGFRREGRLAEAGALAQESAVRERDLRQQIAAEVDVALLDLRTAAAQQQIAAERLQLAEDELAQARERFAAGVAGNIEVINAQSSLIQARDADIDARFGAAVARVALARAVGVARTLR
jgi:outer membrane protein TolC